MSLGLFDAASRMEAACRDELDLVTDTFCEICNEMADGPDRDVEHAPDCPYGLLRDALVRVSGTQRRIT